MLDAQLLELHVQQILDKGLETLILQHRLADLQRLYVLLGRVHALPVWPVCMYICITHMYCVLVSPPDVNMGGGELKHFF